MKVKDLLKNISNACYTVSHQDSVSKALQQMSAYGVSAVVAMDRDQTAGIFTERDLVRCHILFPETPVQDIQIQDVMTKKLIVAEPEDTVDDAMAMMIRAKIRHLPVVDQKKISSLICLEDLVRTHVGALTRELHYLKDYISDLQDAAHD